MIAVIAIIAVGAFICAIASAMGKAPLWVAVILLSIGLLVQALPLK